MYLRNRWLSSWFTVFISISLLGILQRYIQIWVFTGFMRSWDSYFLMCYNWYLELISTHEFRYHFLLHLHWIPVSLWGFLNLEVDDFLSVIFLVLIVQYIVSWSVDSVDSLTICKKIETAWLILVLLSIEAIRICVELLFSKFQFLSWISYDILFIGICRIYHIYLLKSIIPLKFLWRG